MNRIRSTGGTAGVERHRIPGDLVLLPVAIVSLGLLVVNDHFLKERYGNAVTGKLSDFAGLIFFPLLLVGLIEVARAAIRPRSWQLSARGIATCVISTGVVFTLMKTWGPGAEAFRLATGLLEWPFVAVKAAVLSTAVPGLPPAHLVRDTTDLIALPMLILPWWFARRTPASQAHSKLGINLWEGCSRSP